MIALMYHDIEATDRLNEKKGSAAYHYVISSDEFRRHMDCVAALGLNVISLSAYYSGLAQGTVDSDRSVVLTFDDGHESTEQLALPILREYGMVGTAQVVGGFVGHEGKFTMNPSQLTKLVEGGWDVGAHGLSHVVLTELDDQTLQRELVESKRVLEQHLGRPVDMMSIPQGPYDARVRRAAIAAGYKSVFCSIPGRNGRGTDRYSLRRMTITRALAFADFQKIVTMEWKYYAKERLRRKVFLTAQTLLGEERYRAIRKGLLSAKA